eukprot:169550_1
MTFTERRAGGLSVGVPGTIHGLYTLQKYFGSGRIEWKDLFTDAINIATNGWQMYEELYRDISNAADILSRFEATREIYLNDNNEPIVNINETMYNIDIAHTLELTSKDPESAIELWYHGEIAQAIINTVLDAENEVDYEGEITMRHGLLTMDDISEYRAVFREPSQSYYGGGNDENTQYKMYGMNYPSSGSPSIQYLMNLMHSLINDENNPDSDEFAQNDENVLYSAMNAHYLITGNNVVFADRNQYMADMDFVHVPAHGLLNYTYINSRYNEYFSQQYTQPPIAYGFPPDIDRNISQNNFGNLIEFGTSHYFVVDQDNNMACVTTTIESDFGTGVVVPGYGFFLNNELTDFDILSENNDGDIIANGPEGGKRLRKSALNLFDLNDNETMGGKRPRSSMGPMIVIDTQTNMPIIAVGSPGGSTIIATVFQILFNSLIRNIDVQIAIDLPRVWASNSATSIMIEPEWFNNPNFISDMTSRGYDMSDLGPFYNGTQGRCHVVRYVERDDNVDGYLLYGGADDSRWSTASVEAVFLYDSSSTDNNKVIVCRTGIEVKTLTDQERIALIVIWLIVLVFVCFLLIFKDRIKQWYDNRKENSYNEFGNESIDADIPIGSYETNNSARL